MLDFRLRRRQKTLEPVKVPGRHLSKPRRGVPPHQKIQLLGPAVLRAPQGTTAPNLEFVAHTEKNRVAVAGRTLRAPFQGVI